MLLYMARLQMLQRGKEAQEQGAAFPNRDGDCWEEQGNSKSYLFLQFYFLR